MRRQAGSSPPKWHALALCLITGTNVGEMRALLHCRRMDEFMKAAIAEARKGRDAGGVPIGSVLVVGGVIVGRGHNQRVQKGSTVLHAEMDCLENAGRLGAADYREATLYSTLSPCDMCSGAILLYRIPRVVIGENSTFKGPEDYLRSRGVELHHAHSSECRQLMKDFIAASPSLWNEDIGET
jgi:cytosine/creatinine deaminase